jgi:hypothetical protein
VFYNKSKVFENFEVENYIYFERKEQIEGYRIVGYKNALQLKIKGNF